MASEVVTVKAMAGIFERLRERTFTEEDYTTLEGAVGSYLQVLQLLQSKNVSMRELRRLLGYRNSEKLKALLGNDGSSASTTSDKPSEDNPRDAGAGRQHTSGKRCGRSGCEVRCWRR